MTNQQFNAGDQVKVFPDAWSAANPDKVSPAATAGPGAQVHRDAVIVRQMPYDEPPHYEVAHADGSAEIVREDRIRRA